LNLYSIVLAENPTSKKERKEMSNEDRRFAVYTLVGANVFVIILIVSFLLAGMIDPAMQ